MQWRDEKSEGDSEIAVSRKTVRKSRKERLYLAQTKAGRKALEKDCRAEKDML